MISFYALIIPTWLLAYHPFIDDELSLCASHLRYPFPPSFLAFPIVTLCLFIGSRRMEDGIEQYQRRHDQSQSQDQNQHLSSESSSLRTSSTTPTLAELGDTRNEKGKAHLSSLTTTRQQQTTFRQPTITTASSSADPSTSTSAASTSSSTSTSSSISWAVSPRVLLVDDDAVIRKLSSKFLKIFGCTTDVAVDGIGAVTKMNLEKYDLVLMVSCSFLLCFES